MWHFREMSRGEINQDPTQEDYFNTDHLESFSDALVREAIQNSLDAKPRGTEGPVRVRIAFGSVSNADSRGRRIRARFIEGLYPHIGATNLPIEQPKPDEPFDFLVFEDFGTRGLVGDPAAADDPPEGAPADFFYFWRNIGRGKKEADERGRWGLGKTMFPASSRIHSFFGLTVRHDDRRRLLMGQSMLSIHRLDGRKHYPYGYFGNVDADDGFVLPVDDPNTLEEFSSAFWISRRDEPGLTVVMPFPRKEITAPLVVRSVIHHYFFPILSGELIVEVDDGGDATLIDRSTIDAVARDHVKDGDKTFPGTVELAKWFIGEDKNGLVEAKTPAAGRKPTWSDDLFSPEKIDRFADELDSLKPVAVRVPVHVSPKGGDSKLSYFHLVLQRDQDLEGAKDVFIRSGITISGIHSLRESGVRALVVAADVPIVTMLGDAENPAHTEWQDRSRNFIGKYKTGKSTLAFIKDAPRGFLRLLNKRSEQVDDTALRHVFPGASAAKAPPVPGPGPRPDPTITPRPKPDIPSRPRIFNLTKSEGGFSVRLAEAGIEKLPMNIRVRVAYDCSRGNPFKRWAAADFDLGKGGVTVDQAGGEVLQQEGNILELQALSPEFHLSVSGFDPNRDLIVDLRREVDSGAT